MKDERRDGIDADPFARFCRPKLAALLRSLKLDVTYERALGNYLFKRGGGNMDSLIPVLDLVGGFGAALWATTIQSLCRHSFRRCNPACHLSRRADRER